VALLQCPKAPQISESLERTSCDSSSHCRDGHPCESCRSLLECPAPQMCHLSPQDQHVCQSHHGIAEAATGVLGSAQFPACSFYHPRSSRSRFRPTRKAAICAGNFPDPNGISDDCKRQKRSHKTEPVPSSVVRGIPDSNQVNKSQNQPPLHRLVRSRQSWRAVARVGGLVSHIYTEGDREALRKNSNGHPQGWPLLITHLSNCYLPARPAGLTAWFTRLRFVDV
jgi:hypothetical protein